MSAVEFQDPAREARHKGQLAAVVILLCSVAVVWSILPVFRDALQAYYGLTNARFGILLSVGNLAGAFGALVGGPMTDRHGPWPVFRHGLAGCAIGLAVCAIPGDWRLMMLGLAILFFFFCAMVIPAQKGLVSLFPKNRRRILTAFLVGAAVVSMVQPLVGEGLLKAVNGGWLSFAAALHGVFGLTALMLLAGLVWCLARGDPAAEPDADAGPQTHDGRVGGLWLLVALATMHCCWDAMASVWVPKVLAGPSYASHLILPGLVVSLFGLAYVVSRSLLGLMPENAWRRRLMVAPGLAGGLVLAGGLLLRTQAAAAAGYVLGGFCWSVEYPVFLAAMAGDRRFGKAMAALNVAAGVLCFALPAAQGFVADALQEAGRSDLTWTVLLAPAAGFMLNGVLGAVWVRRYGRQLA